MTKKMFEWPQKLYNKPRILEENKLVEKYGLKNKREIWKAESKIKYFRTRAKELITADAEEQKKFFDKLRSLGFEINTIADVLTLNKEDLLKRRLSTVLVEKKIANTPKHARQMIVHKRVTVGKNIVNAPSYLVEISEENSISVKNKVRQKPVVQEVVENE